MYELIDGNDDEVFALPKQTNKVILTKSLAGTRKYNYHLRIHVSDKVNFLTYQISNKNVFTCNSDDV